MPQIGQVAVIKTKSDLLFPIFSLIIINHYSQALDNVKVISPNICWSPGRKALVELGPVSVEVAAMHVVEVPDTSQLANFTFTVTLAVASSATSLLICTMAVNHGTPSFLNYKAETFIHLVMYKKIIMQHFISKRGLVIWTMNLLF